MRYKEQIWAILSRSYHEVADDHREQKERNTDHSWAEDADPHGLDPLTAKHPEDDHERVEEVTEVPAGEVVGENPVVIIAEQLHPHDGENEDDDGEDEAEVAEGSHRSTDDTDEQVERGPGLGQFEHPKLWKC